MILFLCCCYLVPALGIPADAWNNSMAYWMTKLPEQLKQIPIIYLAIPGSHASLSYSITAGSQSAPDIEEVMKGLQSSSRTSQEIFKWSKTQDANVMRQLEIGIRYFDLGIATKESTNNFFFTHGVYANEITESFNEIIEFLDIHREEVVILDFHHFSNFKQADHNRFQYKLLNMFGGKMDDPQEEMRTLTLTKLHNSLHQVIIIYRNDSPSSRFRNGLEITTNREHQSIVSDLLVNLDNVIRDTGSGFVDELVLRISKDNVLDCSTCDSSRGVAERLQAAVLPHIQKMRPGIPPVGRINVVTADFVDMADNRFPQSIVQMNFKLLNNLTKILLSVKEL